MRRPSLHRLSTVSSADRVAALLSGRLVAAGVRELLTMAALEAALLARRLDVGGVAHRERARRSALLLDVRAAGIGTRLLIGDRRRRRRGGGERGNGQDCHERLAPHGHLPCVWASPGGEDSGPDALGTR